MTNHAGKFEIRVDTYTRACLTVIAVLLTVVIVGLWAQDAPNSQQALGAAAAARPPAGIPDSGQQREQLIREVSLLGGKLDRLTQLFESGQAKVQVTDTGKGGAGKDAAGAAAPKAETKRVFIKRTD